jgi:hypothetical protein
MKMLTGYIGLGLYAGFIFLPEETVWHMPMLIVGTALLLAFVCWPKPLPRPQKPPRDKGRL